MADWTRMVHCIGDLHAGAIKRPRVSALLDDVKTLRWLGRLPAPHYTILGNHDVMRNVRRPADWAKVYGYDSPNYVIDLPFVRIVAVGPGRDGPKGRSGTLSK